MTPRAKLELAGAALALLILGLAVAAYINERENRIKAEAEQRVATAAVDAAERVRQAAEQSIAQRDAQAAASTAAIAELERQVKSTQQALAAWSKVSQLAAPRVLTPADTIPNAPSAPKAGDLLMPSSELPSLWQQLAEGKRCGVDLEACRGDLADRVKQMQQADAQIQALRNQSSAWERAAKGGSVLHRVKHDAILILIGVAAGVAIHH